MQTNDYAKTDVQKHTICIHICWSMQQGPTEYHFQRTWILDMRVTIVPWSMMEVLEVW